MFIVAFHGVAHREDPDDRSFTLCGRVVANGIRTARANTNRCSRCEKRHKVLLVVAKSLKTPRQTSGNGDSRRFRGQDDDRHG